ncbi:MCE family protein [Aeromicrobium sp. 50.2.37]|uniref:MCE family protein n=1 Tax=Aeromicrobium sp. 50.2.37 TaxID=2969305 RepID=UPI0021501C65|nr:MCE family protein [Aeromicrobium sp. 50.2.37]MCR4514004.1 MCE family protein [Aeromicrobium sp. 50.2.37]
MRSRTLVLALVAALAVVAVVGWRATAARDRTTVQAVFESSVGLYVGSDVQMLGVPVGTVTGVVPGPAGVTVTMRLDSGQAAAADTAAVIVAPTLVSDRFVQLTKPHTSGPTLEDGAVLPMERTAVPVEIDDLYASLTDVSEKLGPDGANRDGALSRFLDVADRNLRGQGVKINQLIGDFGDASGTLADSSDDLFATISNVREFNDMLVENDDAVADVNRQFAEVNDYLADSSGDLAGAIDNLGEALALVDDFIRDNRGALRTSVENLQGPTRVLVNQREALEETVRLVPLVLQNFLRAYDPDLKALTGRGNLNEASIWNDGGDAPTLLPETNR